MLKTLPQHLGDASWQKSTVFWKQEVTPQAPSQHSTLVVFLPSITTSMCPLSHDQVSGRSAPPSGRCARCASGSSASNTASMVLGQAAQKKSAILLRYGRCVAYHEWWVKQPEGQRLLEERLRQTTAREWRGVHHQTRLRHQEQLDRFPFRHQPHAFLAALEERWMHVRCM